MFLSLSLLLVRMTPFTFCLVRGRVLIGALSGLIVIGNTAFAEDWQRLVGNSPFGQAPVVAAKTTPGELEFRGVVQEEGNYFVNLYNPTTKTSQWVPVKGQVAGLEVKAYDVAGEKVEITQGGRSLTLPLKQAKVALAKVKVPSPTTDKEDKEERKAEYRDMIRERLENGGDPAQVIRNLPPEAQAMMEEFRRRRAERAGVAEPEPVKAKPADPAAQRTRRQP